MQIQIPDNLEKPSDESTIEFKFTVTLADGTTREGEATLESGYSRIMRPDDYGRLASRVARQGDICVDRGGGYLLLSEGAEFRVTKQTMDKAFPPVWYASRDVPAWEDWGGYGIRWREEFPTIERNGKRYLVTEGQKQLADNGQYYYWLNCSEI